MTDIRRKKRIPTPLVLVSASLMVSIGVVGLISATNDDPSVGIPEQAPPIVPRDVPVDQSTP